MKEQKIVTNRINKNLLNESKIPLEFIIKQQIQKLVEGLSLEELKEMFEIEVLDPDKLVTKEFGNPLSLEHFKRKMEMLKFSNEIEIIIKTKR